MKTLHLLLASSILLAGCGDCRRPADGGKAGAAPGIPAVRVSLTRADIAEAETLAASVRAARRAELAPRISGTWVEVSVNEGDSVPAGREIARLRAPEWAARLAAAEAARTLAAADRERTVKLRLADAATPAESDAAEARLRGAEAVLAEARAMVAETILTAPFAGVITRKSARVGDAAAPGAAAITIEDPASLEIEVAVPESRPVPASGERLSVLLRGERLAIPVTEIAAAADPVTRTRTVRARLAPDTLARPGEFARVSFGGIAGTPRIFAPADAVMRRGQVESVWVEAEGRAALRLVRTGRTASGHTEILSGLSGNETLLRPAADLVEGVTVR